MGSRSPNRAKATFNKGSPKELGPWWLPSIFHRAGPLTQDRHRLTLITRIVVLFKLYIGSLYMSPSSLTTTTPSSTGSYKGTQFPAAMATAEAAGADTLTHREPEPPILDSEPYVKQKYMDTRKQQ